MTKDEALKLALEALEGMYIPNFTMDNSPINNAIVAIKEALAQPEQEPWCVEMNGCKTKCADCPDEPAQPEQEPVAIVIKSGVNRTWMSEALGQLPDGTYSLYTTPPAQREWVELTDDDLVACSEAQKATVIYFLAKLKKLNT